MKRLQKFSSALVLLGLLGCAWLAWRLTPWGQLGYVEERTGIDLPLFPSHLFVDDNGEWRIIACAVLDADSVSATLASPRFRTGGVSSSPILVASPEYSGVLPERYRQVPAGARLYAAKGCGKGVSWQAMLDEVTGTIWIVVTYPDWGGTEPACS